MLTNTHSITPISTSSDILDFLPSASRTLTLTSSLTPNIPDNPSTFYWIPLAVMLPIFYILIAFMISLFKICDRKKNSWASIIADLAIGAAWLLLLVCSPLILCYWDKLSHLNNSLNNRITVSNMPKVYKGCFSNYDMPTADIIAREVDIEAAQDALAPGLQP